MDYAGQLSGSRELKRQAAAAQEQVGVRPDRPTLPPTLVNAECEPLTPVKSAAMVLKAVKEVAQGMGDQPVVGSMTLAEVLADPATRASAIRWGAGDATRRLTASLTRTVQSPRFRLHWMVLLAVVLLFPRLVALVLALVIRVTLRGLVSLAMSIIREMYWQALLATAEVEQQLLDRLQGQLGFAREPASPALPLAVSSGSAPPAPPPPMTSHPTQPLDVATIVLLLLNLRQPALGGGGGIEVPLRQ